MEPKDVILQPKHENMLTVRMEAVLVEYDDILDIEVNPDDEATLQDEIEFAGLLVERVVEDVWELLPAGDAEKALQKLWTALQASINREVDTGKTSPAEAVQGPQDAK